MSDSVTERRYVEIPHAMAGQRVDQVLAELFPEFSRSRLQHWIRSGAALIDGVKVLPKQRIVGGESVALIPESPPAETDQAEDITLDLCYEDADVLIVNKPPGLVVHPAAGHAHGTLLNALLHYAPELARVPRCGIVHRLDKDTSGLLMVARNLTAHKSLVMQLQSRTAHRQYLALVEGVLVGGGTVNSPIGRHPTDRKRFAVHPLGKPAVTHYRIEERLTRHTLLRVSLETGRTHQIRVHMAHLRHALVGDPVYGRLRLPAGAGGAAHAALTAFRRQALHAERLGVQHPRTGEFKEWSAPIPDDFGELLDRLRSQP